jgi:ribosomal protein L37AE/L43A
MTPIDMILYCPRCNAQHVDRPDTPRNDTFKFTIVNGVKIPQAIEPSITPLWTNPPHRSHLCDMCGHIWRPADVPTNGVEQIQTKGKDDSPLDGVFMPLAMAAPSATGVDMQEFLKDIQTKLSTMEMKIIPCQVCEAEQVSISRQACGVYQCAVCLPDVTPVTHKCISYTEHEASRLLFVVEAYKKEDIVRTFIERILK